MSNTSTRRTQKAKEVEATASESTPEVVSQEQPKVEKEQSKDAETATTAAEEVAEEVKTEEPKVDPEEKPKEESAPEPEVVSKVEIPAEDSTPRAEGYSEGVIASCIGRYGFYAPELCDLIVKG